MILGPSAGVSGGLTFSRVHIQMTNSVLVYKVVNGEQNTREVTELPPSNREIVETNQIGTNFSFKTGYSILKVC